MAQGKHNGSGPSQTDEALAVQAQAGDAAARRQLLERFRPLVGAIVGHYAGGDLGVFDRDDLTQEGLLALLSAIYAFRPDRTAAFRTFAAVCVTNRLRSVLKENDALKNKPLNSYVPLDTLEIAEDSDPVHQIISDETVDEWFRIFENDLSPLENKVLHCFLKGYSYQEIARMLQITEKAADNALQRIRKKLRDKKTPDA